MHGATARFVVFVTSVASVGGFLFGYDTAVINGANTFLHAAMQLSPAQQGLASSSVIIGCIPGALFAGYLSDRFGRRTTLFVCAALYIVSAILSAVPRELGEFLVARFLGGFGIGASSMVCPVYIAEIAPEKQRGRLGTLFQLGIVLGIFLSLFVNKIIQGFGDESWNTDIGWRWMMAAAAVPAIAFFALLLFIPESPRWLAQHRRQAEALAVFRRAIGSDQAATELASVQSHASGDDASWAELLKRPFRRPVALAVTLMAFTQFCGINAVIYYSSKIFQTAGDSTDAAFTSTVWIGLINLVFTFVAISLVDSMGRRPLLIVGAAVQTAALGVIGWMFATHSSGPVLLGAVLVFIAAFAMSLGPVGWLFCSEVVPSRIRARAMSAASFTVWVSCFIVTQTFPMLNDNPAIGPAKTFWLYAAISGAALLFAALWIPETKGRSLEEIEQMWIGETTAGDPAP